MEFKTITGTGIFMGTTIIAGTSSTAFGSGTNVSGTTNRNPDGYIKSIKFSTGDKSTVMDEEPKFRSGNDSTFIGRPTSYLDSDGYVPLGKNVDISTGYSKITAVNPCRHSEPYSVIVESKAKYPSSDYTSVAGSYHRVDYSSIGDSYSKATLSKPAVKIKYNPETKKYSVEYGHRAYIELDTVCINNKFGSELTKDGVTLVRRYDSIILSNCEKVVTIL